MRACPSAARSISVPSSGSRSGDLTTQSLEEVWTGERYVALRKKLVEEGLFPVCRRCCKVELSAATAEATIPAPAEVEAVFVTAS